MAATIRRHTRHLENVRFLQIGANDGKFGDPLQKFIEDGTRWSGIHVEPVPYVFQRLKRNRSDASRFRLLNVAVSDRRGTLPFYYVREEARSLVPPHLAPWVDQLGSIDGDHVRAQLGAEFERFIVCQDIPCVLPIDVLESVDRLDVLHIDAEGHDYRILRQFPFATVRPGLVIYEHVNLPAEERKGAVDLLREYGYRLTERGYDTIAVAAPPVREAARRVLRRIAGPFDDGHPLVHTASWIRRRLLGAGVRRVLGWTHRPLSVISDLEKAGIRAERIDRGTVAYEVFRIPQGQLIAPGGGSLVVAAGRHLVPGASFRSRLRKNKTSKGKGPSALLGVRIPGHPLRIRGLAFSLVDDLGEANYYHWMVNVLPRLCLIEEAGHQGPPDHYILPEVAQPFQFETLDLLGIPPEKRISARQHPHVIAEELCATTHPCPMPQDVPEWIPGWLRSRFLSQDAVAAEAAARTRLVYISRSDAVRRRLLNEDECFETVLKPLGFERYELAAMSFRDQVALFAGADTIVAAHGAGLVNLSFCRKGARVVELVPTAWRLPMFESIARARDLRHEAMVSDKYDRAVKAKEADFWVDPQILALALH